MSEVEFVAVAALNDVAPDTVKAIDVAGRSILLCHSLGQIFAVENLCSHAAEPLACGRLKRGWISCPTHGARFDLESGEPISGPTDRPIATFPVRIREEMIEIAV